MPASTGKRLFSFFKDMGLEPEIMMKLVPERDEAPAPTTESGRLRNETAARVETVHARQDLLIAAFQEAFGQDLCKLPRHVEVTADGTIVVHGSLYLEPSASRLLPNLRVEGVLSVSKAPAVTEIPDGISARSFIPNAATESQKAKVRLIDPDGAVRAA